MKLIMDSRKPMLQAMIPGSVALDSVVYSKGAEGQIGWSMLGKVGILESIMARISLTKGGAHVNGIEAFCGCAEARLVHFRGIPKQMFAPQRM